MMKITISNKDIQQMVTESVNKVIDGLGGICLMNKLLLYFNDVPDNAVYYTGSSDVGKCIIYAFEIDGRHVVDGKFLPFKIANDFNLELVHKTGGGFYRFERSYKGLIFSIMVMRYTYKEWMETSDEKSQKALKELILKNGINNENPVLNCCVVMMTLK